MTITVNLTPEAERILREKAQRQGEDPEAVAATVLAEALEWEAQDRAEAVEGMQRGLDDFEAGRYRPFSEFAAEQRSGRNLSVFRVVVPLEE
jgi:predicted transcriptional regulator